MKNKIRTIYTTFVASFAFLALLFASCSMVDLDGGGGEGTVAEVKMGSLSLGSKSVTRALNLSDITTAEVTVYGHGMTEIKASPDAIVSGGAFSGTKIEGILVGPNRVVEVQAKKTIDSVTEKLAGVAMYAVTDIESGENSVEVTWGTSAVGQVYYELIKSDYDVSSLDKDTVASLIPANTHSSLVDCAAIAADIKANTTKAADSYKISPASVTVTSDATMADVTLFISDPASAKLPSLSTTQQLSNIAPGTWDLYLTKGKEVLHKESITLAAGDSKTVALALKLLSPRLENSDGSACDTSLEKGAGDAAASKTVYLRVRSDVAGALAQEGCTIYYTVGTKTTAPADPKTATTPDKKTYDDTTGIEITAKDTVIKAYAAKTGFGDSDVVTFTFSVPTIGFQHPSTGDGTPVDATNWKTANYELGAHYEGTNTTFALYSKAATKVLLEIYENKSGSDAKWDYWMEKGSDNIWRAKVEGKPVYYAFRCWGPNWAFDPEWTRGNSNKGFVSDFDSNGNRFNPNKVVFDPYTREMSHDKSNADALGTGTNKVDGGIYGTGSASVTYGGVTGARRIFDTGKYAPKAVVVDDKTDFGTKPQIPAEKAIIYEAHARGLTKHPSSANLATILNGESGFSAVQNIPTDKQGTYAGVALMAPYLKALGVNTIELLPVHESDNDANPDDSPGGNYWAYMTYGYFAPDRRYSSDKTPGGPTKEFKEMVKAFHDLGMEVYLDVVYNHTGEGGVWGVTGADGKSSQDPNTVEITSMHGIDNSTYFELCGDNNEHYYEHTGCGNDMQCDNSVVRQFILDSLTYWITDMGVDGFRFDLAPVLGHVRQGTSKKWGFNSKAKTLEDIAALGASNNVEMIAEAWDAGGCYCVGQFPNGWGEWNGFYRDAVRQYVGAGTRVGGKGDTNDYINGDYNHFNDQGGPKSTVNFIVAHDGFTLADLSTYGGAGNAQNGTLTWPFGPSDGGNGDTNSVPDSTAEGKRQTARNYFALQMISRGIPMIVWGDEFGRTQNGNNNPYNIDSVATWNNYNMINTKSPHAVATGGAGTYHNNFGTFGTNTGKTPDPSYPAAVNGNFRLAKYLLNLRQNEPAFNQPGYGVQYNFEKEKGGDLGGGDNCERIYIAGSAVEGGSDYCVFVNLYDSANNPYSIPDPPTGKVWKRLVDTQKYFEDEFNCWDEKDAATITEDYGCGARSIVILKACDAVYSEKCATPTISATGTTAFDGKTETFTGESISVTLTSATAGARIYYTTDGSTPTLTGSLGATTTNGTLYSAAVTVSANQIIRAIAFPPESGTGANASPSIMAEKLFVKKLASEATVSDKSSVMIQGFNWASADKAAKDWYQIIEQNAVAIKSKFAYIWLPPPSVADDNNGANPQGYTPTQLNDLNNCYGTEANLTSLITALADTTSGAKAVTPIADIVINHRGGTTCWGDFTNPTFGVEVELDTDGSVKKGISYKAICSDDEGFTGTPGDTHMKNVPLDKRGAADTGEGYAAYRDLDHTNLDVQLGIITWMNDKLKAKNFKGWRYDFVKGYDPKYVALYNSATGASFSVGELWPSGGRDWAADMNTWVSGTTNAGYQSRAFDFVLKSHLNSVFGCETNKGDNTAGNNHYGDLAGTDNLYVSNPGAAVTFVDNHDTGSTQKEWKLKDSGVATAYALILTHPGIPCVAWQHYFTAGESALTGGTARGAAQYLGGTTVAGTAPTATPTATKTMKAHIDTLIALRKSVGIGYDSTVTVLQKTNSCYAAKVTGSTGEIIVIFGEGYVPSGTGYKGKHAVYAGSDFVIYQSGTDGAYGHEVPDTASVKITLDSTLDKPGENIIGGSNATTVKVFAWAWTTGQEGGWIEGTIASDRKSATFEVPKSKNNILMAECTEATVTPDWATNVLRQTDNLTLTFATTGETSIAGGVLGVQYTIGGADSVASWWNNDGYKSWAWLHGCSLWVPATFNATTATFTIMTNYSFTGVNMGRFGPGVTPPVGSFGSPTNQSGDITISGKGGTYVAGK